MTDWSPLIQAFSVVMTTVLIPWALLAYQKRTGVALTDQQRAAVLGAVKTAAGTIETKLDQGLLAAVHVDVGNEQVRREAAAAIAAVPNAAAALGMTPDGVARMIVGAVDTAAHGLPLTSPLAHLMGDPAA